MRCTSTTMLLLACRVARVRALQAPLKKFGRLRALASTVAEPGTNKVPVTLLSGFLGTGKTTLLRNLLEEASQDKDSKVGVVVNDMSELDVDGQIVARTEFFEEGDHRVQSINDCVLSSRRGTRRRGRGAAHSVGR